MPLPADVDRVARKTARDQVFDTMLEAIVSGSLAPGEVIRDDAIASRLGVSRTPVREALQRLQHYGMVETEPNRLTRVAPAVAEDIELLYPPLGALHGVAAEAAAARLGPDDFSALNGANARLRAAAKARDAVAAREADAAFHQVLLDAARNPYLLSALEVLDVQFRRMEMVYFADLAPAEGSAEEHDAIIAAAEAGAAARVGRLVRANIMRGLGRRPRGA
ncbi:GntR family transcriptional regulator [Baekduia alba]|uniref:GntR family transcriptional regulator n=1 Tax=Baekduia alba TaxID=2997333 RepID=UPI0023418EDB|nr:GntR family transcriptional regulator [Baekduia alba]